MIAALKDVNSAFGEGQFELMGYCELEGLRYQARYSEFERTGVYPLPRPQ
jgi:hypothetical protein